MNLLVLQCNYGERASNVRVGMQLTFRLDFIIAISSYEHWILGSIGGRNNAACPSISY